MLELLWVRIIFLVICIFAYLGIGKLLLTLTSKRKDLGPAYFWLYLWPLSVVILTPAVIIILAAVAIIIALIIGFILGILGTVIGFAGGFLGIIVVLFFAFFAWLVFASVILSPFEGLELFISNVKKLPEYLMSRHREELQKLTGNGTDQIGNKKKIEKGQI